MVESEILNQNLNIDKLAVAVRNQRLLTLSLQTIADSIEQVKDFIALLKWQELTNSTV